jgi:hypothetical protein
MGEDVFVFIAGTLPELKSRYGWDGFCMGETWKYFFPMRNVILLEWKRIIK